jgi:putative ABC transport system permease protein
VTQVADTYLGLSAYADIRYLSRLVDEEFCMTGAQISVDPRPQVRQALFVELKQLPALQAVSSRAHAIANVMETLVKNQQVFIGLLVMFAGLIFFGSVLNSSLVSLAERTREVATWRVQGYTPWQVGGLFLRESVIVNGLGTLVGLPLGYELAVWVTHAYDTEMFRIPVVNPARAWTLTILLGAAFGLAAHALVQRTIHRLNWLEALQAKE